MSSTSAAVPVVVDDFELLLLVVEDFGLDDGLDRRGKIRGIGGNGLRPLLILGFEKNRRAPPTWKFQKCDDARTDIREAMLVKWCSYIWTFIGTYCGRNIQL
jgi:hypothetical protein